MNTSLLLVLTLLLTISTSALAQSKDPNKPAANAAREKSAEEIETERLLKERRANAQSLLIDLAADAQHFTDDTLSARAQARIADLLWESDRQRSRSMFRSAWDAAETADEKNRQRIQEDIRQQQARNPRGGYSVSPPPSLRREVLGLVARRDAALGEEFLSKYGEQKASETAEERSRRPANDEARGQRFSMATELVNSGEIERALQFAEPGLGSIDIQSVPFLVRLREKNADVADRRYAAMLANAPNNPQSDANTVALLASYIFTPQAFVVFRADGSSAGMGRPSPPVNVSAELRAAFFRIAGTILSRPLGDQSQGTSDAQYLAIKRMMPLFEQYAPPESTAALKAQLEGLSAVASQNARNRDDQFMRQGILPDKPAPDREQSLVEQRERARTSAERDQINLQLAVQMVDKDERLARDYVDKIDDMELRASARAYIDASIAWKLTEKRDADRALEFARSGDLTHFQKAWLLAGAARMLGDRDREKLNRLVDEAATEARRMETSDPDRPRAFFAIANVVFNFNRPGIWEVMTEAIKASNSADKFTGEDGVIAFRLNSNGMNTGHRHSFSDFDVAGIFTKLSNEDYEKAVELARGFQTAAPRANAVIAIARTVLEEKKK
jgi:hypothetical protein